MSKTFITCAVTGAGDGPKRNPHVPVSPDEIANSALAAADAGAAIVHLHVRDPLTANGSRDDDLYAQVMGQIRDKNQDVIINLTAAKWEVIGLKETLAMELGPYGISVNAILTGSVTGPRMDAVLSAKANAQGVSLDQARETEVLNSSMRRMINPQEISALAWFLASPAANSISGQSIGICGNFETLR